MKASVRRACGAFGGVERARGFFRFVSRQFVKKHRVQELCLVEANLEHHLIEFVSGRVFQRRHVR